jgi:hypothetical protein
MVPQRYPTPDASSTSSPGSNHSPLSKGALIGIIVGSVAGGAILGIIMFALVNSMKKIQKRKREQDILLPRRRTNDKLIGGEWLSPTELDSNDQEFELATTSRSEIWTEPVELPAPDQDELRRKGWI